MDIDTFLEQPGSGPSEDDRDSTLLRAKRSAEHRRDSLMTKQDHADTIWLVDHAAWATAPEPAVRQLFPTP